jgi:hypothetical protein
MVCEPGKRCNLDDCDYCGPASMPDCPLFVSEEALLLVELHSDANRRKWNEDAEW